MNAARVGSFAGIAEILLVAPVGRQVCRGIQTADGPVADGAEAGVAAGIQVYPAARAERLLGVGLKGAGQRLLFPPQLAGAGGALLVQLRWTALGRR